jgi:hypothetical protein
VRWNIHLVGQPVTLKWCDARSRRFIKKARFFGLFHFRWLQRSVLRDHRSTEAIVHSNPQILSVNMVLNAPVKVVVTAAVRPLRAPSPSRRSMAGEAAD